MCSSDLAAADGSAPYLHTVPASMTALEDLNLIEPLMKRLRQRAQPAATATAETAAAPELPVISGQHIGRLLGQEVVRLMLEHLTHDERLLPPIRQQLGLLEPEKRLYRSSRTTMTEAAIRYGFVGDVYVALGEPLPGLNMCGAGRVVCLVDPIGDVYACPFVLHDDPGEADMILSNLLTNAVKYNKQGGSATLELSRQGDTVTVRCSDTGIGMTEEEQGRLFGEFVRMKNEHTRNIDGSGLGLSILQKVVKLYGGEIRVQSKYGEGSSFELTLKDAAVPAPATEPALKA